MTKFLVTSACTPGSELSSVQLLCLVFQELDLKMHAVKGIGKDHAKFSPVGELVQVSLLKCATCFALHANPIAYEICIRRFSVPVIFCCCLLCFCLICFCSRYTRQSIESEGITFTQRANEENCL